MGEEKQKSQETCDHLRNTLKNQMFGIWKKKVLTEMGDWLEDTNKARVRNLESLAKKAGRIKRAFFIFPECIKAVTPVTVKVVFIATYLHRVCYLWLWLWAGKLDHMHSQKSLDVQAKLNLKDRVTSGDT